MTDALLPSSIKLYEKLCRLSDSQFGEVLFRTGAPRQHIEVGGALASRAQALVYWAQGISGGLAILHLALQETLASSGSVNPVRSPSPRLVAAASGPRQAMPSSARHALPPTNTHDATTSGAGESMDETSMQDRTVPSLGGAPIGEAPAPKPPAARSSSPLVIVDSLHRGDHVTIAGAIRAATPGTRILVRPGHYDETLVLDKPLEIVGDGAVDDIVVTARNSWVILFRTQMGRVANLSLRQDNDLFEAVNIGQGRLDLADCRIRSKGWGACVAVHHAADPRVRRCVLHALAIGILVHKNGQGTFEDNDIVGTTVAGIHVREGADPVFRKNRIRGTGRGVWVSEKGAGTYEDNDLKNTHTAWDIVSDCMPNVKRARNRE